MRFFDLFRRKTEQRSMPPAFDPSWSWPAGIPPLVGIGPEQAESLSAVDACVRVITSSISALPALVYRHDGDQLIEDGTCPVARLIRKGPNKTQYWPEFIEMAVAQILLRGNCLIRVEANGRGEVTELRVIPWQNVTPVVLASGYMAYDVTEFAPYSQTPGKSYRLLWHEAIHVADKSDDGYVGVSRLRRGLQTLSGIMAVEEYARNGFSNGMQPNGVLSFVGELNTAQVEQVRTQYARTFNGAENRGKAMVLGCGWTYQALDGVSPEDAELLATRKFSVETICRMFLVPPPLVCDYEHNTFTNSEQANLWFSKYCLLPLVRKVEAAFNAALWPTGHYTLSLDMGGFDRGDPETRWKNYDIAKRNNILTVNEIREAEGYSPIAETEPATDMTDM